MTAQVEPVSSDFSGFSESDLASSRDQEGNGPEVSLAAKLYRHSLNKVVTLPHDEVQFLDAILAG